MNIKYRVELSQSERDQLDAMVSGGRHAAFEGVGKRVPVPTSAFWDSLE